MFARAQPDAAHALVHPTLPETLAVAGYGATLIEHGADLNAARAQAVMLAR